MLQYDDEQYLNIISGVRYVDTINGTILLYPYRYGYIFIDNIADEHWISYINIITHIKYLCIGSDRCELYAGIRYEIIDGVKYTIIYYEEPITSVICTVSDTIRAIQLRQNNFIKDYYSDDIHYLPPNRILREYYNLLNNLYYCHPETFFDGLSKDRHDEFLYIADRAFYILKKYHKNYFPWKEYDRYIEIYKNIKNRLRHKKGIW